jgi:hypothetical protein
MCKSRKANKISSIVLYILFSGTILLLSYYKPFVIKVIHVKINYKVSSFNIAPFAIVHAFNSIQHLLVATTSGG